jgi:serine protease Do
VLPPDPSELTGIASRPRLVTALVAAVSLLSSLPVARPAEARAPPGVRAPGPREATAGLRALDASLRRLVAAVSPAVVQVEVIQYGPLDGEAGARRAVTAVARQHTIGSGVIVDPEGYVVTSAHLVKAAQRTRVKLAAPRRGARPRDGTQPKVFDARIVGMEPEIDLAVLKIEAHGLPALSFETRREAEPGQLVFAIGSPEGLASTVTMGVVSAVDRQPDLDSPMVYVQTDAPINPGNSGGPLVDVDGALVGINTFILTEGGGSEGLGFAIPARIAALVYGRLRTSRQVGGVEIGAFVQGVTTEMARGLRLPHASGVIVADVLQGGPSALAGLEIGDVIVAVNGQRIGGLPDFSEALFVHAAGVPLKLQVRRGGRSIALTVREPRAKHPESPLLDLAAAGQGLLRRLGIVAVAMDARVKQLLPNLRRDAGVVVAARTAEPASPDSGLEAGDVIYALNRRRVGSLQALRDALERLRPGDPVVLQIEREGRLRYLAFTLE